MDRMTSIMDAIEAPLKAVSAGHVDRMAVRSGTDVITVRRALSRKRHDPYVAVTIFPNRAKATGDDAKEPKPELEPLFPDLDEIEEDKQIEEAKRIIAEAEAKRTAASTATGAAAARVPVSARRR